MGLLKKVAIAATLLFAVAAEANVNISYTLEGCRSTDIPPGYDLPGNDYVCPDAAYTTGNLKGWAELDLVPHRVTVENKGSQPGAFTFTVGGDYLQSLGGALWGWDYISYLTLNENLSNQICLNWVNGNQDAVSTQMLLVTPDGEGAGGVYTTIYRQVVVAGGGPREGVFDPDGMPAGAKCVADYVQRLALGSHLYSGSSLQSNLWDENLSSSGGQKRIQLPDVQALTVSKDMSANQDQEAHWSISKAGPASVDFGNTCIPANTTPKNVDVNITLTKLPTTPAGLVGIHTIISIANVADRTLYAEVNDTIYNDQGALGVYQCLDGNTSLTVHNGNQIEIPANYSGVVCEHDIFIDSADANSLHDTAFFAFVDPYINDPQWPIVNGLAANASATIQPGSTLNNTVVIKDGESISSSPAGFSFSSGIFDPSDSGQYVGYVQGTETTGDVNWTSYTLQDSAKITFHKTVYISGPLIASGTLSDTATLYNGGQQYLSDASHSVTLSSDAIVSLKIHKTMPDILDGNDSVDINFTVTKAGGGYESNQTINFTAGQTSKMLTINGLAPGIYNVTEHAPAGFEPDGPATQQVDITLPACSNDVYFDNILAGQPAVKVIKVTYPTEIQGVPQKGDWNVTLYKEVNSSWVAIKSILTDPNLVENELIPEGQLEEGHYKMEEIMKNGWYQSGTAGSCEFTVDYPEDLYHQDYVCTFENTKYGKVIINKLTIPSGMPDIFHFAQDVNSSYDLNLTDQTGKVFMNVIPGEYTSTENDPRPNFDLIDLNCTESDAPNTTPTTTSLAQRLASINVDPGETVECTYTNRARGMVDVLKYENNSTSYSTVWNFTLNGSGVNAQDSTPPALMDFGGVKLIPGEDYTLCETGVPVAWINTWYLNGQPVDYNVPDGNITNEDRCYTFQVEANQTAHFVIHNDYTPPGGETRTIGYWKNWTTCDGHGNQEATAAKNGGWEAGFWLLDDAIDPAKNFFGTNVYVGSYLIDSCEKGIAVLNKEDFSNGKKMAGDAAYGLAAQLLAAELNYQAGAQQCTSITNTISDANALLTAIGFNGSGTYLKGGKSAKEQRAEANALAGILDNYNNYGCQ